MKNILIILLLLLPFLSFGKKVAIVEYIEKDTLTQGDRTFVCLKYDPEYFSSSDTLRLTLRNITASQSIEVLKMSFTDINTLPTSVDGYKWIYYTIPSNYTTLPGTLLLVNYYYHGQYSAIGLFIRSSTPDISIKTWSSSIDTTQQPFAMTIDYTYHPTFMDSLKILIGDSVVYHGIYQKSLAFNIPDFNSSSTYNLTIIGCTDYVPLTISKRNSLVSGLFSPITNHKGAVYYYNEQGMEIDKPEHGFYIWKTHNSSGKSYISY
jgi:hypothetical protein